MKIVAKGSISKKSLKNAGMKIRKRVSERVVSYGQQSRGRQTKRWIDCGQTELGNVI